MFFTRKGDGGDTGFFCSSKRVAKDSERPEALGALDELNSLLGVCKVVAGREGVEVKNCVGSIDKVLDDIQQNLFILQSEVAGADKKLSDEKNKEAEEIINCVEKELPEIKNFKISGGTELSAMLDHARAVSRRVERRVISARKKVQMSDESMKYLNRLSSLLFALARLVNVKSGINEESPTYE
jgi:cob(I)alamin adenosyltransferase